MSSLSILLKRGSSGLFTKFRSSATTPTRSSLLTNFNSSPITRRPSFFGGTVLEAAQLNGFSTVAPNPADPPPPPPPSSSSSSTNTWSSDFLRGPKFQRLESVWKILIVVNLAIYGYLYLITERKSDGKVAASSKAPSSTAAGGLITLFPGGKPPASSQPIHVHLDLHLHLDQDDRQRLAKFITDSKNE